MIESFINGIITLIMSLVKLITAPIDLLILNTLPDLSNALTSFANVLDIMGTGIGWAISLSGISSTAISLIIGYYTFKLTTPLIVSTVKLAIKWYNSLKL